MKIRNQTVHRYCICRENNKGWIIFFHWSDFCECLIHRAGTRHLFSFLNIVLHNTIIIVYLICRIHHSRQIHPSIHTLVSIYSRPHMYMCLQRRLFPSAVYCRPWHMSLWADLSMMDINTACIRLYQMEEGNWKHCDCRWWHAYIELENFGFVN